MVRYGNVATLQGAKFDYLVVGAGFAGAVMAERLAAGAGRRVLVVDRRDHIGGNAYDHTDEAGLLVHKYGPHIFHTNSREVFDYLSRFTAWHPYAHRVLASVRGQLVPIPINLDTVNTLYGLHLTSAELERFLAARAEPRPVIRTSEDVVVSKVGRELYEVFFQGYTRKQWGLDPSQLDASVAGRIPVRLDREDRYFTDTYQGQPLRGFTKMFEAMLNHPLITVLLNTDYRAVDGRVAYGEMIYTGPIDAFFNMRYGTLPYRSLDFRFETLTCAQFQPVGTVNYPEPGVPYTRVTEFKHLTGQRHDKTSVVFEYPGGDGDPYYPVPRPQNTALYRRYRALSEWASGVHFVGRLATYRYYNMDQVVAQALALYKKIAAPEIPDAVAEARTGAD